MQAPDQEPKFYNCDTSSFFDFCEDIFPDAHVAKPLLNICGLMRKCGARTALVDKRVESRTYYDDKFGPAIKEIAELRELHPSAECSVAQVTFFSKLIAEDETSLPEGIKAGDILGTCVIISVLDRQSTPELDRSYIFEAIVAFPTVRNGTDGDAAASRKRLLNNYHHIADKITIIVDGQEFKVEAAYFCQQNGINTVCGHVALKMALWHVGQLEEQPPTTEMNKAASDDRQAVDAEPIDRFTVKDITSICRHFGVQTVSLDCEELPKVSPYEYAYLLIESGIPAVIIFESDEAAGAETEIHHVLPVVGHTLNSDEWLPHALGHYDGMSTQGLRGGRHRYIPSVEWVPHLIIHDDLLGPYMCVGRASFPVAVHPHDKPPRGRVRWVTGFLPGDAAIEYAPNFVQEVACGYVKGMGRKYVDRVEGRWRKRLQELDFQDAKIVLRTQVVRRTRYVDHLAKLADREGNGTGMTHAEWTTLSKAWPKRMWMIEFSCVEAFSAGRTKFGELLLPLDLTDDFIEALKEGTGNAPAPPVFRMVNFMLTNGATEIELGVRGTTQIFTRTDTDVEF